jgi:integrase/recombinase XerD
MTTILPDTPVSPLRQKLIDDMKMRHGGDAAQLHP